MKRFSKSESAEVPWRATTPDDSSEQKQPGLGLPNDRVLSEISHEMGNYFHKLYYWLDFLKAEEKDGAAEKDAAFEMLTGTVEGLEHFMRMILEYFAPARIQFSKLRVADVLGCLELKIPGRDVRVEGVDPHGEIEVMGDPALLGHALRWVFEQAALSLLDENECIVSVDRVVDSETECVRIRISTGGAFDLANGSGIEMAVAEKFLEMHGAELKSGDASSGGVSVLLPIFS